WLLASHRPLPVPPPLTCPQRTFPVPRGPFLVSATDVRGAGAEGVEGEGGLLGGRGGSATGSLRMPLLQHPAIHAGQRASSCLHLLRLQWTRGLFVACFMPLHRSQVPKGRTSPPAGAWDALCRAAHPTARCGHSSPNHVYRASWCRHCVLWRRSAPSHAAL